MEAFCNHINKRKHAFNGMEKNKILSDNIEYCIPK